MIDFNAFKAEWIGKRVADPSLAGELPANQWYQCVSLVKQYLREDYGLTPGYWGNADKYWTATNAEILTKFYKVASAEAEQGDIVVISPEHIGIATGNIDASQAEILEQNGSTGNGTGLGKDAIRTRYIDKSRIMGLLRPYITASPAPTPVVPQYTTTPITPKQVKVKPGMHEWNLSLADFETVCNNPTATAGDNQIITVAATLIRPDFPQFSYYLENASSPIGWNTLDCDDYSPPSPPVIAPPYVPPAAPVNVPIATTPILLVTNITAYQSATDAMNRTNKWQTLDYGNYLVYQTALNGMKQIAKVVNGTKYWINPADNVKVPPLVVQTSANVQASFKWFFPTHEPVEYKVLQTILVKDLLHGSPNIQITAGHNIDIYGSFEMGGRTYLRPLTSLNDKGMYSFYGIQTSDIYSGAPYLENEFDLGDEIASKWESFYDKAVKTIEGIFRLKRGK